MLEASQHQSACFCTLTYSPDTYPVNGSLDKTTFQKFMKRLRKAISPIKIRYFGCGEYGEKTQRAHYHAVLFGLDRSHTEIIEQAWGLGFVHVGDLTVNSAQYIAGYVTKKMTSASHPALKGRAPEFALMSAGLGRGAISDLAGSLIRAGAGNAIRFRGDAPSTIHTEGKYLPIGRYLLTKLRKEVGFEDGKAAPWVVKERQKEMRTMFAVYGAAKAIGKASRQAIAEVNPALQESRQSDKRKKGVI